MVLLPHIGQNFYKIFSLGVFLLFYQSGVFAAESVRVLLPFATKNLKITLEKGKIFSDEVDEIDCKESQESDVISEIVSSEDNKVDRKQTLIETIESKQTFNISYKDSIILTDTNQKFKTLIFRNESPTIEINGSFLKGDLEIRFVSGTFRVINVIDIENYLRYTISKEMNPNWPIEALKAQAVLARTYVLKKKYSSKNCIYDIGFSTLDQVYGSFKEDHLEVIQAVSGTSGEVLKYRGEIIEALYHSCCGGNTSSAKEIFGSEKPYLAPKPCQCKGDCPYGKGWIYKIKTSKLQEIFSMKQIENIREENYQVKIIGNKKMAFSKNAFREKVGFNQLKSSKYNLSFSKGELNISGNGFGHTVGLCQYGAKKMAEEGKNYQEILFHYFSGISIEKIY